MARRRRSEDSLRLLALERKRERTERIACSMSAYPNPALYCCLSDPGVDGIFSVTVTCVKFAGTVERGVFFFCCYMFWQSYCRRGESRSRGATTMEGRIARSFSLSTVLMMVYRRSKWGEQMKKRPRLTNGTTTHVLSVPFSFLLLPLNNYYYHYTRTCIFYWHPLVQNER